MQYFELFGLEPAFQIDIAALAVKYREVQAASHPDKFVSASETERRAAQQRSALINDAHNTLKNPVNRAAYLLRSTYGADPFDERNTKMPADFLIEQMDLREALADHKKHCRVDELEALHEAVRVSADQMESSLAALMTQKGTLNAALVATRKLRFQHKLLADIDDALAAIA